MRMRSERFFVSPYTEVDLLLVDGDLTVKSRGVWTDEKQPWEEAMGLSAENLSDDGLRRFAAVCDTFIGGTEVSHRVTTWIGERNATL